MVLSKRTIESNVFKRRGILLIKKFTFLTYFIWQGNVEKHEFEIAGEEIYTSIEDTKVIIVKKDG